LSEFRVAFKEGQTARFVHIGNDPSAASAWVLHDLDVSPDYAAAIAYRGETRQIAQSLLLPVAQLTESAY
jgi:hypothetical protein